MQWILPSEDSDLVWGAETLLSSGPWIKQERVVLSDPYISWSPVLGRKDPVFLPLLEACEATLPGVCSF